MKIDYSKITPDFISLYGSRLYGTHGPDSDHDYRGFWQPPLEISLSLFHRFTQHESIIDGNDRVIFSIEKIFKDWIKGSTTIEILFSPEYICSPIGELVLKNRHLFLSANTLKAIRGFALSEWSRTFGVTKQITIKDNPSLTEQLHNFCSAFHLTNADRVDLVEFLKNKSDLADRIEEVTARVNNLGENRLEQINKVGYDYKKAYNCLRLLTEGIELASTGKITFPLANAKELIDIKNGNYPIDKLRSSYNDLYDKFIAINSILPDKPDYVAIDTLYRQILMKKD